MLTNLATELQVEITELIYGMKEERLEKKSYKKFFSLLAATFLVGMIEVFVIRDKQYWATHMGLAYLIYWKYIIVDVVFFLLIDYTLAAGIVTIRNIKIADYKARKYIHGSLIR